MTLTADATPTSSPALSGYLPTSTATSSTSADVLARIDELRFLNQSHVTVRPVIRAILNGGAEAVRHLVADSQMEHVPAANLIHSGIERIAQKLTDVPGVRVNPPYNNDSARARNRAEKRERIVEAYDHACNLGMQVPQAARWLPGYGFAVWTVGSAVTEDGQPFPALNLRDPFGCLPGPWTIHQQPADIAFVRRVPEATLRRLYPGLTGVDLRPRHRRVGGGAVILDNSDGRGWEGTDDGAHRVVEYRDAAGIWLLLEDSRIVLDFEPVPTGVGTPFVVAKRFAFDQLIGQFDHVIGLQQMLTRLNILAFLAVSDEVFAPTNVFGRMSSGEYRHGRNSVNEFEQGTRVERPQSNSASQSFQQIDRIERHARIGGAYPVTDDAQSPNSFVTGRGLQELTTGSDNVVNEYHLVFQHALQLADRKRLAWDEGRWPDLRRTLPGQHKGSPYTESYTPSRDIKGDHQTRRQYGMLAGLDSSARLVGLLQMMQGELIDNVTAMENVTGIDDVQQVLDRIDRKKAQDMLDQAMVGIMQGAPVDDRVLRVLIDRMPAGPVREKYEAVFFPEPEEGQEVDPVTGAPVEPAPLAQPGEGVGTILSRLMANGTATSGAQTVGRF